MEIFEILCGIIAVILALYYFFTSTFDFWKSRGVPGPRPIPVFGTFKDVLLKKISLGDYVTKVYNEYKDEPFIGIFFMRTPILIVKDLEIMKDIFIKDFSTFADRGFTTHEKAEPLSQNLFNLEPERWRPLRPKLTPFFTSRKMKEMFLLISECSDHLIDHVDKLVRRNVTNEPIECLELTAKYTTDCIGSCTFGIEMNTLSNEESEFRRIGRDVFHQPWTDLLRARIKNFSPLLYDILGYILPDTEITKFFISLVTDSMKYRDKNNIVRHDFIDMLRELKKNSSKMNNIEFTDSFIASQAFIFFAAGYETSSTAMTNTLYELALHQKVQDRLRKEINEEYTKYGGSLTYENVQKMNYLDKVFKEILRKYPAGFFFTRKTTSSYTFNGTKVSIPKGQRIWIPIYAIYRDPDIYPKPNDFDPERFNEEAVRSRHPMVYLPFGDGPRNCIGARFGIYQTKLGIIKILQNYKIECCEKTQIPYVIDENIFVLSPKNGIYLRIIKVNQT